MVFEAVPGPKKEQTVVREHVIFKRSYFGEDSACKYKKSRGFTVFLVFIVV
jgi:hypothetical protein